MSAGGTSANPAEPQAPQEAVPEGRLLRVAGTINGHTHAAMTLFRGYADDLPLMEWLERHIWPAERRLEFDDVYWGTRLACSEMIRNGTVRFWDMYWQPGAVARAVRDSGLRAVVGAPLIDGGDPAQSVALRESALRSIDEITAEGEGTVMPALAPHAIYSVSEESLRWIAGIAEERDLPVHIHLSETEDEVAQCLSRHGIRPAAYLDRVGLLGPRTVIAHGVWLDEAELDLIAEREATVVTNPVANMKLAVGRSFPYVEARERGVRVGLGTDGAGSNNSLDLLADVKTFALLQKHEAGDPAVVTAVEAWEIATGQRSPLLAEHGAGDGETHVMVRADSPELSLGELEAGLVYAAGGSIVDTTVVSGRTLMRGGVVEGIDEVVARTRERAQRLGLVAAASGV
jgi:5-methylthioadenosine/S-adenosylhomocysteine deaminase